MYGYFKEKIDVGHYKDLLKGLRGSWGKSDQWHM